MTSANPRNHCVVVQRRISGTSTRIGSDTFDSRSKLVMQSLLAKFPDRYEGRAREKGESPVVRCYLKPFP